MKERKLIKDIPEFILPKKNEVLKINENLISQVELLEELIDRNADIKVLTKEKDRIKGEDYYHDFVYFVLTKTSKTLRASILLAENVFPEDSQILLRSVYENYLTLNHLSKNIEELDFFLRKTVGLAAGIYSHPLSKNNKVQRNKILHPETGEISNFGISINKMADSINSLEEKEIHKELYPYLCELTHLNMISSGNYRDSDSSKYIYDAYHSYHNPYFFSPYVLIILCDFLTCEIGFYDEKMSKKIFTQNKVNKLEYLNFVSKFGFYKEGTNLTELIIKRLEEKKIRKKVSI
ncbi:DUF5677 domain-containing protein [uncultured Arcticibacterium sp.]|uniref:DUF5677 domain-containing protein n=1 Tax=uncultured Arcticibacterium sp. TaxID=2173042 RepID=UPI0030F862DB